MDEKIHVAEGDAVVPFDYSDIDVDEVLKKSGPCKCFQFSIQFIIMFFALTVSYQTLLTYFTAHSPPWKCVSNTTSVFCEENYGKKISVNDPDFYERCKLKRNEWTYTTARSYSLVTEFDLVCDKKIENDLSFGVFFIGAAVGSIILGFVADAYGRRLILISCLVSVIVFSTLSSFINKIWQLILLRVLIGATYVICDSVAFIILCEFLTPFYRPLSANLYHLTFNIAQMLLTAVAYSERNWRKLQLYTTFPCVISLALLFFIPKSPRWLLAVGKTFEAERVFKKVAKLNRKPLDIQILNESSRRSKRYTYFDLFKHRKVAIVTFIQAFLWAVIGLLYHIATVESSNLGKNIYTSRALSALSHIPSNIAAVVLCRRFGRKKTVLLSVLFSSFFIPFIPFASTTPHLGYTLKIILALLTVFFARCAYNVIFVWSFELFPTIIRTQGWVICIICFRVSGLTASLLITGNTILPYIIACILGVLSSLIGLVLPETNRMPPREKYEDFFNFSGGYDVL